MGDQRSPCQNNFISCGSNYLLLSCNVLFGVTDLVDLLWSSLAFKTRSIKQDIYILDFGLEVTVI